jgi:hypothetical protein
MYEDYDFIGGKHQDQKQLVLIIIGIRNQTRLQNL